MTAPDAREVADRLHSAAIHLLRWLRREDERSGLHRYGTTTAAVFAALLRG